MGISRKGKDNSFWGRHHTSAAKKKMSDNAHWKGRHLPLKIRNRVSEVQRERLSDPRNHYLFGKHPSLKTLEKMSKASEGSNNSMFGRTGSSSPWWGRFHSPETLEKMSQRSSELWKDPKYAKSVFAHRSPNNKELECFGIIDSTVPKDFKFVGNGQVTFGGKCPDFMNVNGKKLLIEFNGEYWHKGENTRTRARHFAKYGYRTLFIWQRELKNPEKLKRKILKFVEA